ncbi:sugar transferase [Nocardioides sp. YIM 152315]|uniref:sugar transferase n=1 Tax=Nocardioides sp. YIM 152315 TaxID=3031760 RepID=UPI0023DAD91A|nr:sugar transferase [Nocardioides sp. YIM 152315]MDF1603567.1 sugar transferase [Nocardioides sp. YIM 152315]
MTSLTSTLLDAHRATPEGRAASGVARPGARGLRIRQLLPAADLAGATAVVLVAGALAPGESTPRLAWVTVLAWCLALAVSGAWTASDRASGARAVLRAGVVMALAFWVTGETLAPQLASDAQVGVTAALALVAAAPHLLVGARPLRVAIAGGLDDVGALVDELRRDDGRRWDVTSICLATDDPVALSESLDPGLFAVPVWLGADAVVVAAEATGAQAVIVVPGSSLDAAAVRRTSWSAHEAGLDVYVGTGLLDVVPSRVRHVSAGVLSLARVRPRTGRSVARAAKHLADRALAGLALLAFLPLLGAIALAIRWDSPGPALYSQRRTGRGGDPFTMYKFRTMRTDAEQLLAELAQRNECDDVLFKMREDPRITRVGRILRRYSLDELPQLINVLRGEMSLVGPRPALPTEVAQYERDPRHRLAVKPGLTGLWQVSGRSDLSWDESVRLDLHYVDNWSWALDLRILGRTVGAVVGHRGAY